MAANNYFGFTHGGTQYAATATGAPAYQAAQTGYAVAPTAAAAATYTTQRAAPAYDTAYPTAATHTTPGTYAVPAGSTAAPTTYDYGYARSAYDTGKTYYQQPAAAAAAASYSTTDYQVIGVTAAGPKPAYSATYTTQTTRPVTQPTPVKILGATPTGATYSTTYPSQQTQVKKTFHPQQSTNTNSSTTSYVTQQTYSGQNSIGTTATANYSQSFSTPTASAATATPKPKPATTTYSGYDAALFNATSMYIAQNQNNTTSVPTVGQQKTTCNNWQNFKKPMGLGFKLNRPKGPAKPQQLHYCEVCKISCAGPQTYREHLEGQKHKKKESSLAGSGPAPPRGGTSLRCELCDITCTGTDAYTAHIRGAKHQKVVKLHTKLGKPIPQPDPKGLPKSVASSTAAKTITTTTTSATGVKKTVVSTPKINFVQSGSLGTVKVEGQAATDASVKEEKSSESASDVEMTPEPEITPVGQEYIEEITNDDGKVVSFNCKLCECKFNDPNAKEMHMKGRRHRLQFKKKVNPDLVVDIKSNNRNRKLHEERLRNRMLMIRKREEERMMEAEERIYWEERRRYEEELDYYEWYRRSVPHPRGMPPPPPPGHPFGPPGPPLMGPPPPPSNFFPPGPPQGVMRRPDTFDDKHILARHAAIYPKESELQAVQKIVSHTERALKFVSDQLLTDIDKKPVVTGNLKPGGVQAANKPGVAKPGVNTPNKPSTPVQTGKPAPARTPATTPAPAPTTPAAVTVKKEPGTTSPAKKEDQPKKEDGRDGNLFSFQKEKTEDGRVLKGVMRVGVLAKGLLLSGDTQVRLVVLCTEKPTRTLLNKVATLLPQHLKTVAPEDSYTVEMKVDQGAVVVTASTEPKIVVTVSLTSPLMREPQPDSGDAAPAAKDPPDVLSKQKCLDALAALRHAKWFQARATGLQSCVMIIRILRDLCRRNPTWSPLNSWAMELLTEKVLSSNGAPMLPGESLRRILEALSAGILLPGGPGLLDPCEKEPVDASANLTPQQREDLTASAQHALRMFAFRQIHKVLGMEMLPQPKYTPKYNYRFTRKRRRDNSNGEGNDSEAGDGKKDKKDGDAVVKMETDKSR